LRTLIGAWTHGDRADDQAVRDRVGRSARGMAKWLAGGGFAIYAALRMMSLGERWLERTWAQQDALTSKVGDVADALQRVAASQQQVVERIDLLLDHRAGEEAKPTPKPFKARPVP
jgi:hypothetical protein